ncbi:excalibur calcium-binding domain-containing protein [Kocuria rosea]|uniref:excalibur calcium-binding domain-containing protein n=1 Tax=Kocuria rosea TaxID=1275 RepID=UPI00203F1463|nr:excalibur calcium-binding domain-containing protein [Kocuria rosea]MCM3687082.1 excalibur calcium-binding domain-containing protein [Kocuria rosea]
MKKMAAGMAVLAAAGFTGLSMAPASAAQMFQNCTEANNAGLYNIPVTSPAYSPDLDRGGDGVACEGDIAFDATRVPGYVAPVAPVAPGQSDDAVFDNCTEARAAGRVNIPVGDPAYGLHLDADRDGFGCDADGTDDGISFHEIIDWVPAEWNTGQYDQMGQVPVGGADTGVAVEESSTAGGLAAGGGLALAAAAGAAVVVRRRAARA